jgi:transcriptional regulator NrdR family protein
MTCPECGGKTRILRTIKQCDVNYRRRKCIDCDYIFFTTETEAKNSRFEYYDAQNDEMKSRASYMAKYRNRRKNKLNSQP